MEITKEEGKIVIRISFIKAQELLSDIDKGRSEEGTVASEFIKKVAEVMDKWSEL